MQNYRNNMRNYMSVNPRSYSGNSCWNEESKTEKQQVLAMAYVPWQKWRDLYEPSKAFCRGTIFEELDKPFYGAGGRCR